MITYRYEHSCTLAMRDWPSPGPVGHTPLPSQLVDSCLKQETSLAQAISTLNNTTIVVENALIAKDKMSKDAFDTLSKAGYVISNQRLNYLPVKDKDGNIIGHTTESYVFENNGVPVEFSFSHEVGGQSYIYSAYISIFQSVYPK